VWPPEWAHYRQVDGVVLSDGRRAWKIDPLDWCAEWVTHANYHFSQVLEQTGWELIRVEYLDPGNFVGGFPDRPRAKVVPLVSHEVIPLVPKGWWHLTERLRRRLCFLPLTMELDCSTSVAPRLSGSCFRPPQGAVVDSVQQAVVGAFEADKRTKFASQVFPHEWRSIVSQTAFYSTFYDREKNSMNYYYLRAAGYEAEKHLEAARASKAPVLVVAVPRWFLEIIVAVLLLVSMAVISPWIWKWGQSTKAADLGGWVDVVGDAAQKEATTVWNHFGGEWLVANVGTVVRAGIEEVIKFSLGPVSNAVIWAFEGVRYTIRGSSAWDRFVVFILHMLTAITHAWTAGSNGLVRTAIFVWSWICHVAWNMRYPEHKAELQWWYLLMGCLFVLLRWMWGRTEVWRTGSRVWDEWEQSYLRGYGTMAVGIGYRAIIGIVPAMQVNIRAPPAWQLLRGACKMMIFGREVSFTEFVTSLSDFSGGALWLFAANSGLLYRPANGPAAMAVALYYRTLTNPQGAIVAEKLLLSDDPDSIQMRDDIIEEMSLEYLRIWQERMERLYANGFSWPVVLDEPVTVEEYALRFAGPQRARFLAAAESWRRGQIMQGPSAMPKSDEVLGVKLVLMTGGVYVMSLKPRTIVVFSPQLGPRMGPLVKSVHYALKDVWSLDRVHTILGHNIRLVYASGATPHFLSAMARALESSQESVLGVAGDDVIARLVYPKGGADYLECDLSMCDQTLGVGPHKVVFPQMFTAMGFPAELWKMLMDFKTGPLKYRHVKSGASIVVTKWPLMMDTGSPVTTTCTSAATMVAYTLALIRELEESGGFERELEELGLNPKVKRMPSLFGATFLRGWFAHDLEGVIRWYPLPNPCKIGKSFTNPDDILRKCDPWTRSHPGMAMCRGAAGSLQVPYEYPVLGEYKRALERCAGKTELDQAALDHFRIKHGELVNGSGFPSTVNREEIVQMTCARYGCVAEDIVAVENLLRTVQQAPFFVSHRLFDTMAEVDYC